MPTLTTDHLKTAALFAGLVALGAASRFMDIAPNFAAIAGVALFAGFVFRSRLLAALVPVTAMLISDAVLGGYPLAVMTSVYLALMLPVFFKPVLGERPGVLRIAGSSIACSVIFFVVTNFAVWGAGGLGYAKTAAGLAECYTNAVPFFRFTLLGDLTFAGVLFGSRALLMRPAAARQAVTA